jgi:hypothetical protein
VFGVCAVSTPVPGGNKRSFFNADMSESHAATRLEGCDREGPLSMRRGARVGGFGHSTASRSRVTPSSRPNRLRLPASSMAFRRNSSLRRPGSRSGLGARRRGYSRRHEAQRLADLDLHARFEVRQHDHAVLDARHGVVPIEAAPDHDRPARIDIGVGQTTLAHPSASCCRCSPGARAPWETCSRLSTRETSATIRVP